jgi:hypothetical protein
MLNTDARRAGDDPDNIEECTECGYDILSPGREMCDKCFQDYHGPDNDKDLDPESIGGFTYDIQAIKDTKEGT